MFIQMIFRHYRHCIAIVNQNDSFVSFSSKFSFQVPLRQQLVLNLIRFQMNIVLPVNQHGRKTNSTNTSNPVILEQKWIWCDLLATMMQSKSNDENFVVLVIEIVG